MVDNWWHMLFSVTEQEDKNLLHKTNYLNSIVFFQEEPHGLIIPSDLTCS